MTTSGGSLRLIPWYLNSRRLAVLTDSAITPAAQVSLEKNSEKRVAGMFQASRIADAVIASGRVPNLIREIIDKGIPEERVLASLWAKFTFRGLPASLEAERRGEKIVPASFSGAVSIGSQEYELSGTLSHDHLYSQSSIDLLSGTKRAFILGQFEFQGKEVIVHPYVIGDFAADLSGFSVRAGPATSRLYPSQVDAFKQMDDVGTPSKAALTKLRDVPESHVKQAFAEIIGEPFVPKDWGGEKSDLYTSRLTIDDAPISAAFIFKGPAVRGVMHPADLGKRGDQLVRAFDEPAELIVVQHCDQIATSVVRQAEALAADPMRQRRYCIIDGADTFRILQAYGKL